MIRKGVAGLLGRWLGRLRYPWLFAIAALLLVGDLIIPDVVPFIDEILLTVITLLLGSRRKEESEGEL